MTTLVPTHGQRPATSAEVALAAKREATELARENALLRAQVTRLERRNRELVRIIVDLGGEGHEALKGTAGN